MSIYLDSARVALLALAAFTAVATPHPPADNTARSAGIGTQSCVGVATAAMPQSLQERILDPSGRWGDVPLDPAWPAAWRLGEESRLHNDWAELCRYHLENASLRHASVRVVFIGDSITELWKVAHPEFFADGFVDRGIAGQVTGQMLVRFHQDVISLKPAVVHILAGTSDVAGVGGPTTLEAIRNNILSMIELAVANDVRVVMGSIPPAGAFPWQAATTDPAQRIVELNEWLRRLAHERGLIYVDYHQVLADERDAMKQTYSNDGMHPNRDGYSAMEPLARRALLEALHESSDAGIHGPVGKPVKDRTP